jgi:AAHS family 4-hydroxybenzoate transporter-like MFS transporter
MDKKEIEITSLIDSAKYFGLPFAITLVTIFIMLVDGFDLQAMGFVAPEIVKDWGIKPSDLSAALPASMVGMAIGSILLGWASDVIGRKTSYIISIVFLGIGSFFCAHANDLTDLTIWRVVTGVGLGGVTPIAATLITEWTPKHARNVAVACSIVAVPFGGSLGAMIAREIIPAYGWRGVFWVGALLPLVFFVVAIFLLPESPKYLARRPKHHARLAQLLNRLFREQRFTGNENFVVSEPPPSPSNWFATLLNKQYRWITLLLWAVFAFNTVALYSYANLLPTVLTSLGMSTVASLKGSVYLNAGAVIGAIGGAFLIGRFGSRYVSAGLACIGIAASILIGMTVHENVGGLNGQTLLLITFAGIAVNGLQSFIYTVSAHSYPTYIRNTGVGTAQTFSRIGGFFGTWAGAKFFGLHPQPPVGYFFYAVAVFGVLVLISFYPLRTHIPGKSATGGGGAVPAPAKT